MLLFTLRHLLDDESSLKMTFSINSPVNGLCVGEESNQ